MRERGRKEDKDSQSKLPVFLLLLICMMLGIVTGIILTQGHRPDRSKGDPSVSSGRAGGGVELVIDPNAKDSLSHSYGDIQERGVVIAGRDSMALPADTRDVTVDFVNPEENAQLYYLTFELRLYDRNGKDYEILYTSDLVEPGKHIERITLSRELEEGVYDAVIHVQPYRMDEGKTLTNNVDMRIRLVVG